MNFSISNLAIAMLLAATVLSGEPAETAETAPAASVSDPYQRAPRAILVVPRVSHDLPEAMRQHIDPLTDSVVSSLSARAAGMDVMRRSDDLPLGIEGSAGGVIEMLVTCEYASYESTGASGMTTQLHNAVPTQLMVHLRGRPGAAGAVMMDIQVEATKESPQTLNQRALRDLCQQHAAAVTALATDKIRTALAGWDPGDLAQRLTAVSIPSVQPPLIGVSCTTEVGKDRSGQPSSTFAATGARDMYADMVYLLARRLGPVRLTTDTKATTDATIHIANTVWYQMYGSNQGMLVTHSAALPYRCEMEITLTSASPHRWVGTHTYKAATTLPDSVTRSGGYASEATRIVAALTGQIGDQLESELAYERTYRAPGEGEVDEYVIIMNPTGSCAAPSVQATKWMQSFPAAIQTAVAKRLAPAKAVTAQEATVGRVAGVLLVSIDGALVNATYPDGTKAINPRELNLTVRLQSCYSATSHTWEGEHAATLKFDAEERTVQMRRKPGVDPNAALLLKALRMAFPKGG